MAGYAWAGAPSQGEWRVKRGGYSGAVALDGSVSAGSLGVVEAWKVSAQGWPGEHR